MDKLHLHYEVEGNDFVAAGEAAGQMKRTLRQLGIDFEIIRRCSICMYEGEINMVAHAEGGVADVIVAKDKIVITLEDTGPGITDMELAMQEGYSTATQDVRELGFGAGMGLPNMKRYADEMTVESTPGVGTKVVMEIRIPSGEAGGSI